MKLFYYELIFDYAYFHKYIDITYFLVIIIGNAYTYRKNVNSVRERNF